MNATKTKIKLGYVDCDNAKTIRVSDHGAEWVYTTDDELRKECHHPADRCGGPYHISGIDANSEGDKWFIFWVADSHFPPAYLVRGDCLEDAYAYFLSFAENMLRIDDSDLADYGDDYHINDNGVAVDDSSVHAKEAKLLTIEFDAYGRAQGEINASTRGN